MKVIRTIKPGKPGSRRFQKRWGDKLIAVRYRTAPRTHQIYTTVEIIVDKRTQLPARTYCNGERGRQGNQAVAVSITWAERELREQAKRHGARWSKKQRVWIMRYDLAVTLAVHDRIVPGLAEECTDVDIEF